MTIMMARLISERLSKKIYQPKKKIHFQLAQLLPMEENFLLLFRFDNPLDSSVEFMKVSSLSFSLAAVMIFVTAVVPV